MLSIDPDRVDLAVRQLRSTSEEAEGLIVNLNYAIRLSDVMSQTQPAVRDAAEELDLLAQVLACRADLARGFTFGLFGLGNQAAGDAALSDLYASLIDDDGYSAALGGDLGLMYVRDNLDRFDLDGDGKISADEVQRILYDELLGLSAVDRAAAAALASGVDFGDGATVDGLTAMLEVNDALRLIAPATAKLASQPDETRTLEQFKNDLIEADPANAANIESAFSNEAFLRHLDDPFAIVEPDEILIDAINLGAFLHSGTEAIAFVGLLPTATTRGFGIDIRLTQTAPLASLLDLGINASADFEEVCDVIVGIPETTDGLRNHAITWAYAAAEEANNEIKEQLHPESGTRPGVGGNTWAALGAVASFSVGSPIKGDESFLGVGIAHVMSQSFADGNQIIAAAALGAYTGYQALYKYGEPTQAEITAYLDTFTDGEAELRQAMYKQILVNSAPTEAAAQRLQLESNVLFGVFEQTIVDSKLDFRQLSAVSEFGARVASGLASCATSFDGLSCDIDSRSGGGILADDGAITVPLPDDATFEIGLNTVYGDGDTSNNTMIGVPFADLDLGLEIDGLPPIAPAGVIEGVRSDPTTWIDDDGKFIAADDWSVIDQRMPPILAVFYESLTDPRFAYSAEYIASQGPLPSN